MPKLNDTKIRQLAPPATGRRIVTDTHRDAPRGFAVRVTASGARTFVLRYTAPDGKDRLATVGDCTAWTAPAARRRAAELRREIDAGIDPLERQRVERAEPTVAEMVERWLRTKRDRRSYADIEAAMRRHLVPAVGKKKMRDVRRRDVIALLEPLAERHARQAGIVLTYTKQLFGYAEDREIIEANPVATLKAAKIGQGLAARKRARVLSEDEIRALWERVETCGLHRLTALALQLILVTGQRPGEVAGMRDGEIDGPLWTIPAERRGKTETAHTVPLTDTAVALIEAARAEGQRLSRRHPRTGDYVFEARAGRAISSAAIARAVSRYAAELGAASDPTWGVWTPHDLRRTMRTGLSTAGISEVVAEAAIGHVRQGIAAVYDLHRYDAEKRAALEAWERRLLGIAEGKAADANVVPLRRG